MSIYTPENDGDYCLTDAIRHNMMELLYSEDSLYDAKLIQQILADLNAIDNAQEALKDSYLAEKREKVLLRVELNKVRRQLAVAEKAE